MNNFKLFIFIIMSVSCEGNEDSTIYSPLTQFNTSIKSSSNNKLRKSYALTKDLFIEEHYSYQDTPSTQMVTVYLTDSLNFKVVLANFDEQMSYEVVYDSIYNTATGIGLEYKYKADSILEVDTIKLNEYKTIHRMDSALNSSPVLGEKFYCKNAEFKNRYKMSGAVWSVPESFTLMEEDYVCNGNYIRAYYLSDSNCRILLKVDQSNGYSPLSI